MEKASRFYKQPKMKQKEYIQILQQRQANGAPQSLHQLKMQRGAMVQRSYSDAGYRQQIAPNNKLRNGAAVTRTNSNVSSVSSRYSGRNPPWSAGVNRSNSDGIRLVNYRNDNRGADTGSISGSSVRTNYTRPLSSADVTRSQSMAHMNRPASVDLDSRGRPRSILKKSSSFNDINNNREVEQDLIFDDEYLDYISPRDLLSTNDNRYSSMDYSFEGELGSNTRKTRPLSPKSTKRVNFKTEPVYYKGVGTPVRHDPYEHPMRTSHSLMEQRILQQQKHRAIQSRRELKAYSNNQETPMRKQHNNNTTNQEIPMRVQPNQETPMRIRGGSHTTNGFHPRDSPSKNSNHEQPFEIRKPLVADNNVVDFGTYISKKLSKLKFGSSSSKKLKDKHRPIHEHVPATTPSKNITNVTNGATPRKGVRTSQDGNFTMLSDTGQSNGGPLPVRNNFINQEVLY